jgi:NAD(P)-dependent dehydrogenase (short-subunit alcohol dehydrogenase family)
VTNFKRVALVSGGASGIGKATALAFAQDQVNVVIFDINENEGLKTAASINDTGGSCLFFQTDVAKPGEVKSSFEKALAQCQRLDYLFNNAAYDLVASLLETSESDWDQIMNTILKSSFMLSQLAVASMLDTGGGVIVNNASDAGLRGIQWNTAYSIAKAGIVQLTRSIAIDYGALGIRCNCICPGCIDTPLCRKFNQDIGAKIGKTGKATLDEFVARSIPMQRVGTADEVASLVTFLCSSKASYINGAIIPIDGGLTAGL